MVNEMDVNLTLADLVSDLQGIDDICWGIYAFSRDRYYGNLNKAEMLKLIEDSVQSGMREADKLSEAIGSHSPEEAARYLGIRITYSDIRQFCGRIVFATFTHPDLICINREPIAKACSSDEIRDLIPEKTVENLIIGHELYHVLEDRDPGIWTNNRRITIRGLLGIKHQVALSAPSEIAAMAFSKRLSGLSFSPFLLDIMLYWSYNKDYSFSLYKEISSISAKGEIY